MIQDNSVKMDILLSKSATSARFRYIRYLVYHLLRVILLSIFMGVYYRNVDRNEPFVPLILTIVVSALYFFYYLFILCQLGSSQVILGIGTLIQHVGQDPNVGSVAVEDRLNSNVASVYDFTQPDFEYTPEQKSEMESTLGEIVAKVIIQSYCLLRSGGFWLSMSSICLVAYFISILVRAQPDRAMMGVLITLVILGALCNYQNLIYLTVILLFPLIVIVLCFVYCCCKQNSTVEMPEIAVIEFSPTLNLDQHDCRICFQNFAIGDKIQIIPCGGKHVFHEFCITSWFRVSNTCPLCRRNVAQAAANPQ